MKTRMKFISSILMLLIIATTGIWAQGLELAETPASPTNDATAGLAATEADQFMNVLDWSNVKFDKVFTYMSFQQKQTPSTPPVDEKVIDLGAAFKAGPVYIGSWYKGKLGFLDTKRENKEKLKLTLNADKDKIINQETTKTSTLTRSHNADHNAVMLLGFGNIGINFGYARSGENASGLYYNGASVPNVVETNSNDPNTIDKTEYSPKGYSNAAKHIPFVGFGMNLEVGKLTLSPKASLQVLVNQDSNYGLRTITKKFATENSNTQNVLAKGHGYVGIMGKAGVGLGLNDALNSSFEFTYDFDARIFDKTYTDLDKKKHKVRGEYTITTDEIKKEYNVGNLGLDKETRTFQSNVTGKSFFDNTLTVSYKMQKNLTDRLSLFAGVELPFGVKVETQIDNKGENRTFTTTKYIDPSQSYKNNTKEEVIKEAEKKTNTTTITIDPKLQAAVSYAAVPNRLFLNMGTNIKLFNGKYSAVITKTSWNSNVKTTTTTTKYESGYKPEEKTEKIELQDAAGIEGSTKTTNKYGNVVVELKGGLRWNIVENFAFDLVYTQSLIAQDALDLLKLAKLKLACSIKF